MSALSHAALLSRFAQARIVCVGDVMLDRYITGSVTRISPEAPIPVILVDRSEAMPGASANVARNIAALGGQVTLVGTTGADDEGKELAAILSRDPRIRAEIVTLHDRPTTFKVRYVSGGQQLLRADREDIAPIDKPTEERILKLCERALGEANLLILSDYAKGLLTASLVSQLIACAKTRQIPVVVDPKSRDFTRYAGATLIKPNASELSQASGLTCRTRAEVETAARNLLEKVDVAALLVTRSEAGMLLVERSGRTQSFESRAIEVFDVSGAGDTALAVLALGLAAGGSVDEAASLANEAAGIAVGKRGTAVVTPKELDAVLHSRELRAATDKIKDMSLAVDQIKQWRRADLQVGFTNGCFDLLHQGHVSLLSDARGQCDRLIVGLNTDASTRRLKGESRPVNSEMARAIVLASLQCVDMVVLFDEDTPTKLIEAFRPDVLVKGADYSVDKVVGASFVESYGGRVYLAPLVAGHSTTGMIGRIQTPK